jgi:hypothetical protein
VCISFQPVGGEVEKTAILTGPSGQTIELAAAPTGARCSALAAVPALGTTAAATANRALVRLWATAVRVRDSQASASRPLLGFLVPRAGMSIVDVSFALYQSPANVVDLLRLNMLDDAMSLPKNLPIRYRAAA